MKKGSPSASAENSANEEKWILRLYIAGKTPNSKRAIANLNKICAENLQGQYILEVIDLIENPHLAAREQIIAVPALIKKMPLPLRRLIGDMSNTERVLVGLDLKKFE